MNLKKVLLGLTSSLLLAGSQTVSAKSLLTYYCPSMGGSMEGGSRTALGSRVVTFEESGVNGNIPTLASWTNFAGCKNTGGSRKGPRCVIAIKVPGASTLPGYAAHVQRFAAKYPAVCPTCDTIIGVMEDIGGAFNRQNKKNPKLMFDLAVKSTKMCRSGGKFRTDKLSWKIVGNIGGSARPN